MKKLSILATMLLGLIAFTACSTDRDDNPVLSVPEDGFALYAPGIAANVIDLDGTEQLVFKCNQPNYGYTAPVTYVLQLSIDGENWVETTATQNDPNALVVDGNDLAVIVTNALVEQGYLEEDFPMTSDVYARVRAYLSGNEASTSVLSSVVHFRASTSFALPEMTLPETLHFVGSFNGWNWETCVDGVQQNGQTEYLWHILWIDDQGFKFNINPAWDGGEVGFDGLNSIGGSLAGDIVSGGGNIASSNPGWYMVKVKVSLVGRSYQYDLIVDPVEIYLIGPATPNGAWDAGMSDQLFSVPTTNTEFVSPAFGNATAGVEGDCLRVYTVTGLGDWWQSEFIVMDGKIAYRGNGGDQDRVGNKAGGHLYLNFSDDTGRIE